MGNLPPARIRPQNAFTSVGIDYAGQINISPSKGRTEVWTVKLSRTDVTQLKRSRNRHSSLPFICSLARLHYMRQHFGTSWLSIWDPGKQISTPRNFNAVNHSMRRIPFCRRLGLRSNGAIGNTFWHRDPERLFLDCSEAICGSLLVLRWSAMRFFIRLVHCVCCEKEGEVMASHGYFWGIDCVTISFGWFGAPHIRKLS